MNNDFSFAVESTNIQRLTLNFAGTDIFLLSF